MDDKYKRRATSITSPIIAIIGSTSSGKTSISLEIAKKYNAIILSLDSLLVYKEINISSAKPSAQELSEVLHFGINEIYPDEKFNVMDFANCYFKALKYAKQNKQRLIIVGGSSFYLKSLIDGLSPYPTIDEKAKSKAKELLRDKQNAYNFLKNIDKELSIHQNDTYRIEKNLEIYFQTGYCLKEFNKQNPKTPIIKEKINILNLQIEKETLNKQIIIRSKNMIKQGLINEVQYLSEKYNTKLKPMQSIGIKEVLEYINKKINEDELESLIIKNTKALAKRQRTFNKTQFDCFNGDKEEIKNKINDMFTL